MLCILYFKFVFTHEILSGGIVLFLIGIFVGSYYCTAITYLTEIAAPESAVMYAIIFHVSLPLSGALIEVMVKWLSDWKIISTMMALAPLTIIIYFTHMAESPRYLASKEEYDLAKAAANTISQYNTGKINCWEFLPDPKDRSPNHIEFSESRNLLLFQHCFFLNYMSTKSYLASFGVLLFATGFIFSGLALTQKQIFPDHYSNTIALYGVEFVMIIFTAIFVRILGHLRSIYFSLAVTGITGICLGCMLWLSDSAQGVVVYIMKLFSLMAFLTSISLSAEVCPPRLRSTGFGIIIAMGTIGLICGGLILQIYGKIQITFGIVSLVSIIFVNWVGKLSAYSTMDDIYEVIEKHRKLDKQDANAVPMTERATKQRIPLFSVKGTRVEDGNEFTLGIEFLEINMKGEISYETNDQVGEYTLSGSIKNGGKITILKKYKDGSSINYEGEFDGNEVKGKYESNSKSGEFNMKFKDQYWVGEFEKDETKKKIEWILCQNELKVNGLGKIDKTIVFISGNIENGNKLNLQITDEDGSEERFEGNMSTHDIKGKLNGISIELTNKS